MVQIYPFFSDRNHCHHTSQSTTSKSKKYFPLMGCIRKSPSSLPQPPLPRRVLGFNASLGRGFVLSNDFYHRVHHQSEVLFLDTPSHPNLQIVCSRIMDQPLFSSYIPPSRQWGKEETIRVQTIRCDGITFQFAIRFVCSKTNTDLFRLLRAVYWEEDNKGEEEKENEKKDFCKYGDGGVWVMIPFMKGTSMQYLWGCGLYSVPTELSVPAMDGWIERVAKLDQSPF